MARTHGVDPAGRPVNLIGQPLHAGLGSTPGVVIVKREQETTMAKAESNGEYRLNGNFFVIRKGDPMPDGAEFIASTESTEQRAQPPAPEVKAKPVAPENKAQPPAPEVKAASKPADLD